MNYTKLSDEALVSLGEEREIIIDDDPSRTDYAFSKGKSIEKFDYDDWSLCKALKLVHYRKLAESTEEPALKHLREIRVSLIETCWEEVHAHWRFGLGRKVPEGVSDFIKWSVVEFVRLLQSCNFPFRGDRNLCFRYEVNQYACNFQFFLDLEWEDGFGDLTPDRDNNEKLTPEVFLKDKEVLRGCLEKFQAMEEIVLQGVEVPVEPTENSLGTFEVVDKLFAIDPCYQRSHTNDARLAGVLDAQAGTWRATACNGTESGWGYRCRNLLVDLEGFEIDSSKWEQSDCCVSVDSGQAGFYCASIYPKDRDESEFYDIACESHGEFKAGIHPNGKGVTSSAGFGDGGYSLYYIKNSDGKVCAARIVYIDEEGESTDPGMIMFGYIFGRFGQLAQLEDGWAGEGSKAPSAETLKFAQQFALNGFGPSFIFANSEGHITMYRIKRENGKWTRFVKTVITCDSGSGDYGLCIFRKRVQGGYVDMWGMNDKESQERAIKKSWEFTDPKESSSDLAS